MVWEELFFKEGQAVESCYEGKKDNLHLKEMKVFCMGAAVPQIFRRGDKSSWQQKEWIWYLKWLFWQSSTSVLTYNWRRTMWQTVIHQPDATDREWTLKGLKDIPRTHSNPHKLLCHQLWETWYLNPFYLNLNQFVLHVDVSHEGLL